MTNNLCPYMNKCKQTKRQECITEYKGCTIYQRLNVINPASEYFIGSTKIDPTKRHLEELTNDP